VGELMERHACAGEGAESVIGAGSLERGKEMDTGSTIRGGASESPGVRASKPAIARPVDDW
jgi:hypothetical protein